MRHIIIFFLLIFITLQASENRFDNTQVLKFNLLTKEESRVIVDKGTERPFSGKYYNHKGDGTYTCKRCDAPLYKSSAKFDSGCGWPSFDDEIKGAIKRVVDADARRTEILCAKCDAHLGHVFMGEGFTKKNTRHCVNSLSLNFEENDAPKYKKAYTKKAYFAGGCFWGIEYHLEKLDGVKSVTSGYMGGHIDYPTYREVSSGRSGHLEVVEVIYDPKEVDYETLAKLFFEIHDSTQRDGQGPDVGSQYLSAVFTSNEQEKNTIKKLVKILQSKGLDVSTKLLDKSQFFKAKEYHQDYYEKHQKKPYCHTYKKIF